MTNKTQRPDKLYDFYVRRGESENWIKDFELPLRADRLSCCRFRPTSLGCFFGGAKEETGGRGDKADAA